MRSIAEKLKVAIAILYMLMLVAAVIAALLIAHFIACRDCNENGATCTKIGIITYADRFKEDSGEYRYEHEFEDIENGDILITDSVHTFGWRHGHVAIVTDADEMKVLEAVTFGVPTKERSMKKWSSYSNVVHVRLTDKAAEEALVLLGAQLAAGVTPSEQLGSIVARYASDNVKNIEYSFLPSLSTKAPLIEEMTKTHCAHLVWYVYRVFGVDLDSDGGMIVTPKDLYNSEKLEIVEKFGFSAF